MSNNKKKSNKKPNDWTQIPCRWRTKSFIEENTDGKESYDDTLNRLLAIPKDFMPID